MGIPIIIPCFNNHKYVENTLKQLKKINPNLLNSVIILNNSSNNSNTIKYLKNLSKIKIINNPNNGPWINNKKNVHIYNILPEKYIITDPDLEFNENLPKNFIDILSNLSDQYKVTRIGFAIKIEDFNKMYQDSDYLFGLNIYQWENQNYQNKLLNSEYELYGTGIDTTFCLINKNYINDNSCIRVGGNFTCRHLPFYIHDDLLNMYEKYLYWSTSISNLSTIAKLYRNYIVQNYQIINIRNETILIQNQDKRLEFWKEYETINKELLDILDKYLNLEKNFIELNTGINKLSVYSGRKSNQVYTNNTNQYFTSIYTNNLDNIEYFSINSDYNNFITNIFEKVKPESISIINIDINGQEENILDKLIQLNKKYSIPIIIKFYNGTKHINLVKDFKFICKNVFLINY